MSCEYKQLLRQLYRINVYNPLKTGLDNMQRLNSLLGDPLRGIPVVHVTGTNGKGSVAFKIARALTASGIRTGLFTSPHISSFKERIQVNYELISEEEVETLLPQVFDLCAQHSIPATFFEITTALAMMQFQRARCEAVVLEVGIGGRLDSTNIVHPALSVITTVQLDHMSMLGNSLEDIAREKAGIIKPGVAALVGPGCPYAVMKARADEVQAPLFTVPEVLPPSLHFYQGLTEKESREIETMQKSPSIFVDTEVLNTDIARAALHLLQRDTHSVFGEKLKADDSGIEDCLKIRPPCRYEEFTVSLSRNEDNTSGERCKVTEDQDVRVILDIAHNEDAIKALVKRTQLLFPNSSIRVVIGMSADKAIPKCLPAIAEVISCNPHMLYCTQAPHPRAISVSDLRNMFGAIFKDAVGSETDSDSTSAESSAAIGGENDGEIRSVLRKAVRDALVEQGKGLNGEEIAYSPSKSSSIHVAMGAAAEPTARSIILVCGSAFIMSDAREELGVVEPFDGDIFGGSDEKKN